LTRDVYALLPEIPTDLGDSFFGRGKSFKQSQIPRHNQLEVFKLVVSKCLSRKEAVALGQILMQSGINCKRRNPIRTAYHDFRLTNLRRYGYFDIERKAVVNVWREKILESAFNRSLALYRSSGTVDWGDRTLFSSSSETKLGGVGRHWKFSFATSSISLSLFCSRSDSY